MNFVDGINSPVSDKQYARLTGEKNDPPGNPVGPYLHGSGGLFNIPQTADGMLQTIQVPLKGALGTIPNLMRDPIQPDLPSEYGGRDSEFQTIITGVTEGALSDFGNQPTTVCNDFPVGGLMKVCTQINTRARFGFGVREVEIGRAGRLKDRIDPTALRLLNNVPAFNNLFSVPSNTPSGAAVIVNEFASRLYESMVDYVRLIAPRVWTGSPANNSGERRDWVGLDIHINAGNKIDAFSSAVCTAADSVVLDFGLDDVEGSGRDIVEYLEEAEYQAVEWNGSIYGLDPISGWIFMRPEVWRKVSEVWPIRQFQEALNQMAIFTSGRVNVDGMSALRQRQEFRSSMMLPLNGRNYLVVLDDSMPQEDVTNNGGLLAGEYASDIVFVPATVLGGMPVTYFTNFNHGNDNAQTIETLAGNSTFTTDAGLFRWFVDFTKGCLRVNGKMNPQLKSLATMVAWRVNNVKVVPLMHTRSYKPTSPYHHDGGVTTSPTDETFYSSWNPTTPGAS